MQHLWKRQGLLATQEVFRLLVEAEKAQQAIRERRVTVAMVAAMPHFAVSNFAGP